MTVPSIKTFSKSLKYVDTTYSLLRAGTFLSSQYGPNSRKPESGKSFSRRVSNTSPLGRVFLRSSLDSIIPKHISELEGRTNGLKSRDFMNLPGVTGSKNLTPAVESGANFYFDTHKLVTTLQSHGFSLDQAETITDCLTEILTNGATTMSRHMVSRNELAQLEIRMSATVEALRKDMVILEKSEFLMLKQENENMKAELTNLSKHLRDELLKLRSGLTLDMSLEKGRLREETSLHEQKIKDTNNRIETEIAKIRMEIEAQKLDMIKYIVGSFLSILTVLIGWWRFVKN